MTTSSAPGRPPLGQRRRQATLLELSDTAAELFVGQGVAATTVQQIADRAGVSARTFHRYFPSKADALAPAVREGLMRYLARVEALPIGSPLIPGLCDALEQSLAERRTLLDIDVVRLVVGTPELTPAWLRAHEDCAVALVPILARHLAPGTDPVELRYAAAGVVTANRLGVEAWIAEGGPVRAFLERCLHLLARGVLPGAATT
ncbi:TetR/AcrR family transcriptional regulator [Kineosporia succinea]|uniref:AcrR family transcriptional regulator n=1 Tax=Kineosporia succinea TaxID=84632 RepID=A0ABT9PAE0_9ACTN|nr:TetR/AcrR family transcriptional regulator [Kineosporia succinea]MDP9829645.1 AcrR family transcriptional regulator [Kineosporia succinea]